MREGRQSSKKVIAGWISASVLVLLAFGLWLLSGPDPADHFKVLSIVSDRTAHRHAVVYHYRHSDSSTTTTAVWITSDRPPKIGSEEPARGSPVLVWPGAAETLALKWVDDHPRLLVRVSGVVNVSRDVNGCYFDYDRATSRICVDTARAEVVTDSIGSN
jgi:hypothetical protein